MTSLIDVIFLLLLFFMLTSTFSKFAEIDLAGAPGGGAGTQERTVFLQVAPSGLRLNTQEITLDALRARLVPEGEDIRLLLSLAPEVTSQRLVDVLLVVRAQPGLSLSILADT